MFFFQLAASANWLRGIVPRPQKVTALCTRHHPHLLRAQVVLRQGHLVNGFAARAHRPPERRSHLHQAPSLPAPSPSVRRQRQTLPNEGTSSECASLAMAALAWARVKVFVRTSPHIGIQDCKSLKQDAWKCQPFPAANRIVMHAPQKSFHQDACLDHHVQGPIELKPLNGWQGPCLEAKVKHLCFAEVSFL